MTTERHRSGPKPKPLAERLWAKVDKTAECWLWTGYSERGGYGVITLSTGTSGGKPARVHRVAWELENGPIPDGMYILHSCDTPLCVRPAHLRPGTALDNMRDRLARDRYAYKHKTHCPHGHPYAGANLITRKDGSRECRICSNAGQRNRKRANSEQFRSTDPPAPHPSTS